MLICSPLYVDLPAFSDSRIAPKPRYGRSALGLMPWFACIVPERNLNQLQPGTIQANQGINPNALRPYLGFGAIRLSENAGKSTYNGLQISIDRRYNRGLKIGMAYTLSKLEADASDKRNIMFNAYDPSTHWAIS